MYGPRASADTIYGCGKRSRTRRQRCRSSCRPTRSPAPSRVRWATSGTRGLSERAAARKLGTSQTQLRRMEDPRYLPSLRSLARLATVYGYELKVDFAQKGAAVSVERGSRAGMQKAAAARSKAAPAKPKSAPRKRA